MNLVNLEDNKNNIIKKHNDLVNKARYSLSESGIKLVSMLIAMIRTDDETFQEYHIKVNEFTKLKGSSSKNDYEMVHSIIKELLSCPVKIGNLQANFIASGEYKEGEAVAVFEISQKMKPYLLQLQKDFLEYDIKDILSLRSSYVIRLYELIVQEWKQYKHYNQNAKSFTFELEIAEMRELFEIPNAYQYSHLKERVIDKAKEQFKIKTNITFDYKEYKIGRAVKRLIITVRENNKGSNDPMSDLKSFIAWIRKDFRNVDLYHVPNKQCISVNADGKIYDKYQNELIDNKRSQEIWEKLYQLAKDDKLSALKQGKLF